MINIHIFFYKIISSSKAFIRVVFLAYCTSISISCSNIDNCSLMKNGLDESGKKRDNKEKEANNSNLKESENSEVMEYRLERIMNSLSQKYSSIETKLEEEKLERLALEKKVDQFISEISKLENEAKYTKNVMQSICNFTLTLQLKGLKMKKIKESIMEFIATQILDLDDNEISVIENLENLICLKRLSLQDNKIMEIKGLEKLISLQVLRLSNNKIIEIKGLEELISLQDLNLSNNQITEIKGLEKLISLQDLNLNNNKITEIKRLESNLSLERVVLNYNQIEKLNDIVINSLKKLTYLNYFSVQNNKITEVVNVDLADNGTIIKICLEGNDVKNREELKNLKIKGINYIF